MGCKPQEELHPQGRISAESRAGLHVSGMHSARRRSSSWGTEDLGEQIRPGGGYFRGKESTLVSLFVDLSRITWNLFWRRCRPLRRVGRTWYARFSWLEDVLAMISQIWQALSSDAAQSHRWLNS